MTNEVIIRCQKTAEVSIWRIPAYAYTPNTPLEPVKNLGGLGKIWGGGGCAPWSQPTTATENTTNIELNALCFYSTFINVFCLSFKFNVLGYIYGCSLKRSEEVDEGIWPTQKV